MGPRGTPRSPKTVTPPVSHTPAASPFSAPPPLVTKPPAPKPTPKKPDKKFPTTKPKAPKTRSVYDKPDPIKVDTRAPAAPPPQPLTKAEQVAKAHPLGSTNRFILPPPKVVAPKVTDHVDLFNGGRTDLDAAAQARIIKNTQSGKISKEQLRHFQSALESGHLIPASIAMSHLNVPISSAVSRGLVSALIKVPNAAARTTYIKSLNLKNYNIFKGDPAGRAKYIKFLNQSGNANLPSNASDAEIISAIGEHHDKQPEGWQKLNPFNGHFGETFIHPLFNDFVVAPAHIGAGVAKGLGAVAQEGLLRSGSLNPAKAPKESEDPVVKFGKSLVAGEEQAGHGFGDMVKHPGKALQNDPIGLPIQAATLGESAIAKAGSLAGKAGDAARLSRLGTNSAGELNTLGKAGDLLSAIRDRQNFTPRDIKLTEHAGAKTEDMSPLARAGAVDQRAEIDPVTLSRLNNEHTRRIQEIEKKHRAQMQRWNEVKGKSGLSHQQIREGEREIEDRHQANIKKADDNLKKALRRERLKLPKGEPTTPVLNLGYKSPKIFTRAVQNYIDAGVEKGGGKSLFSNTDAQHPIASRMTKQDALIGKEIKKTKSREVAAMKAQLDEHLRALAASGRGLSMHDKARLLETHAQGLTHEQLWNYRKGQKEKNQALLNQDTTSLDRNIADLEEQLRQARKESPSEEKIIQIDALNDMLKEAHGEKLTPNQRILLEEEQKRLDSHINFHSMPHPEIPGQRIAREDIPLTPGSNAERFVNTVRAIARHGDNALKGANRLENTSAMYRNYEPAINVVRDIKDHPLQSIAQHVLDLRDNLQRIEAEIKKSKFDLADPEIQTETKSEIQDRLSGFQDARTTLMGAYGRELRRFRKGHLHGRDDPVANYDANRKEIAQAATAGDPAAQAVVKARVQLANFQESMGAEGVPARPGHTRVSEGTSPAGTGREKSLLANLGRTLDDWKDSVAGPARIPREVPKVQNPYGLPVQSGDLAGTPFHNSSRLKRTSSVQFRGANYIPGHIDPFIQDAIRLQRDLGGEHFLDSVTHIPEGKSSNHIGVTRIEHGARVGDVVADPENWVLRSEANVRRPMSRHSDVAVNTDRIASAADAERSTAGLEAAWEDSLHQPHVTADTVAPKKGGPYVLVPKVVDHAIRTDLRYKQPPEWVNQWFRGLTLYTRPGYAGRNILQNIPLAMLEANPVALAKGLGKAFNRDNPMVPGVDQGGLFGVHSTEPTPRSLTPSHLGQAVRDHDWHVSVKNLAGILTDSVKAISNSGENWTRRGLAHARMTREAKILTSRMQATHPDIESALKAIAEGKTPEARAAQDRVMQALVHSVGDYHQMPKWEKASAIVPFWRWYYHVAKTMIALPFRSPFTNAVIQGLGNVGSQYQQDLGQDFHSRSITDVPVAGPLNNARTINSEAGNPFTSLLDVRNNAASVSPLTSIIGDTIRGQDQYGNDLKDKEGLPLTAKEKAESIGGQLLNLAAPVRLADSVINPGQHSPESLPFFDAHNKYLSAEDYRKQQRAALAKPDQPFATAALNYLTGIGLNQKNITGEAKQNAQDAKKSHRTKLSAERKAHRVYLARQRAAKARKK